MTKTIKQENEERNEKRTEKFKAFYKNILMDREMALSYKACDLTQSSDVKKHKSILNTYDLFLCGLRTALFDNITGERIEELNRLLCTYAEIAEDKRSYERFILNFRNEVYLNCFDTGVIE